MLNHEHILMDENMLPILEDLKKLKKKGYR